MVAKHRMFVWLDAVSLPANVVIAFGRSDDFFLGLLQSKIHEVWALKQGTRLETRPRYTPTTCFETFPFPFQDDVAEPLDNLEARLDAAKHYKHIVLREEPVPYRTGQSEIPNPKSAMEHREAIAEAARELNQLRESWLNPREWTETRTLEFPGTPDGVWARYIDPGTVQEIVLPGQDGISESERKKIKIGTVRYPRVEPKNAECAAKLKKRTLTNLYNERPQWLADAHMRLDAAVAAAYGWPADLSDEQILEKLLALNFERAAEEAKTSETQKRRNTREKHAEELI